jgi:cytochrome P450
MGQINDIMLIDPHAAFAQMRGAGRVVQIPLTPTARAYLITHHDDAKRALTDPRFAKAPANNFLPPEMVKAGLGKHMLNFDGAEHSRLRRLVSLEFTPRRIEALRPRIQEISDSLIEAMRGGDSADLIDDYAFPLPFQVICELIGVPMVDRDAFRSWSNILLDEFLARSAESAVAASSMLSYVQDLVARKRSEPDDALLSGLIQAGHEGDRLGEDELTSLVFLLLVAGHETTVNLIGNAMLLLLRHPDRLAALRAEPGLIPAAIEEVLRFESPVKMTTLRMAAEDVTVGDTTIPAGSVVFIGLMSANRDAAVFAGADTFDPDRTDTGQHLAFGHGIHFCLGAPLARLEGRIAVEGLLRAFPGMSLAAREEEAPRWRAGRLLRGLAHLPVRLA